MGLIDIFMAVKRDQRRRQIQSLNKPGNPIPGILLSSWYYCLYITCSENIITPRSCATLLSFTVAFLEENFDLYPIYNLI